MRPPPRANIASTNGKKKKRVNRVNRASLGRPSKTGSVKIKRADYCGGLKSDGWAVLRTQCFVRDSYTCRDCGRHVTELDKGEALNADHVKPICRGGQDKLSNLKTRCSPKCHGKRFKHGKLKSEHKQAKVKKNKARLAAGLKLVRKKKT